MHIRQYGIIFRGRFEEKEQEDWSVLYPILVLVLIGPRQVGKTTLLNSICGEAGEYLFVNGDR